MTLRRSIDEILAEARSHLDRVEPGRAAELVAAGGLLVDIRPVELRRRDGEIPCAAVVDRNVLEWRLDPTARQRMDGIDERIYERDVIVVCDEGYASSLAANDLQRLGLGRATDLAGGFQAWRAAGLPVRSGRAPGA